MAIQLQDLEQKQDEVAIITKVLTSLPAKYRHVVSAWDSLAIQEQTMANLLPRLLKEGELCKSMTEMKMSDDEDSSALYTKSGKKNQGKYNKKFGDTQTDRQKFKGICHYCKKHGHMKRDCRKLKADVNGGDVNSATADELVSSVFVASGE
ncbi:hypothetical protein KM043_015762 [Ampulex compressa]|nr:hypothetical protein KM043_015762 [Ampulex compressa]